MPKDKTYGKTHRSAPKERTSQKAAARDARSGGFVMGRDAFGKISEVEGIVVSRGMKADLRRLGKAAPEKRRTVLSEKYGKK